MDHNNHTSQMPSRHRTSVPADQSIAQNRPQRQPDQAGHSNAKTNSVKKPRAKPPKRPKGEQYKRNRTIFNVAQLDALAKIFQQNRYPDAPLRKKISDRLDVDDERVQIWFQNRRAKTRRNQRKEKDGAKAITIPTSPAQSDTQHEPHTPPDDTQLTVSSPPQCSQQPTITNSTSYNDQQQSETPSASYYDQQHCETTSESYHDQQHSETTSASYDQQQSETTSASYHDQHRNGSTSASYRDQPHSETTSASHHDQQHTESTSASYDQQRNGTTSASYHDQQQCETTSTSYHDQQVSETKSTSYHDQRLSETTSTSYHDQQLSETISGSYDQQRNGTTSASHHDHQRNRTTSASYQADQRHNESTSACYYNQQYNAPTSASYQTDHQHNGTTSVTYHADQHHNEPTSASYHDQQHSETSSPYNHDQQHRTITSASYRAPEETISAAKTTSTCQEIRRPATTTSNSNYGQRRCTETTLPLRYDPQSSSESSEITPPPNQHPHRFTETMLRNYSMPRENALPQRSVQTTPPLNYPRRYAETTPPFHCPWRLPTAAPSSASQDSGRSPTSGLPIVTMAQTTHFPASNHVFSRPPEQYYPTPATQPCPNSSRSHQPIIARYLSQEHHMTPFLPVQKPSSSHYVSEEHQTPHSLPVPKPSSTHYARQEHDTQHSLPIPRPPTHPVPPSLPIPGPPTHPIQPSLPIPRPPTHPVALAAKTTDKAAPDNSYTQHYISSENGHTSRVHVSNAGRSTKNRLRPEKRVLNPPPNRVCTAVPEKAKDELSQALFRVGLAIGQSAGLQVDTSQLNPPIITEKETAVCQSQAPSNQRLPKKRRRHDERKYADSDTSSDSDEEGMSRKRHRRINGVLDRGGPPNRIETAVPISDRTLPVSRNPPVLPAALDVVPDALLKKTCQELEDEHVDVEALDSPFSIDMLSSPDPKSPPESPSSTSSSSMSDWSDFGNDSAPKSSTTSNTVQSKPPTTSNTVQSKLRSATSEKSNPPHNRVWSEVQNTDRLSNQTEQNRQTVRPMVMGPAFLASRTRNLSATSLNTSGRSRSIDSASFATHVQNGDHLSGENSPYNRHRSLSGPAPSHQSSDVTRQLNFPAQKTMAKQLSDRTATPAERRKQLSDRTATSVERRKQPGMKHRHPEPEFRRCDLSANPYSSSSSSANDENRRNQVCEILAESRQVADYLSSSSPAGSPFSERSGTHSPASWLFSPRSPIMYSYDRIRSPIRSPCQLPNYTSPENHWQPFQTTTTLAPSIPLPQHPYYSPSLSRRIDGRPSSHSLIRPVAKFPDMSPVHYPNHRSPLMSSSVYLM